MSATGSNEHVEERTMSYPEPRYPGDQGEVKAVFRSADREPDLVSPIGRTHYLATHASTGGEFGLYRVDMGARAPGPSTHFHRSISESFFVLSGHVDLYDGARWTRAGAGDFLYVPAGGLHAFRNGCDEPASMLLLFSPGAPREEYFEQVAEMARRGGEEFAEFLVRHDNFLVPEPE
jgi:mannose-6-phosphate isomerase-like protein (cupin superfamily)